MSFDDDHDPAMDPVREAGGGESEGFEEAERALIDNASHADDGGTGRIFQHADFDEADELDDAELYGAGDEEGDPDDAA